MARQRTASQVNQFIGGLNTEGNPLSFPPNSSSDELNMDINLDGSRSRRRGFNAEDNYTELDTGLAVQDDAAGRSQFRWKNPGGNPSKQLLVVQIGNYLGVHDLDYNILSDGLVFSATLDADTYTNNYSYAVVDGVLVVATGLSTILTLTYASGIITEETKRLKVRDFFGVEAIVDNINLTSAVFLGFRPPVITDEHIYNLRNQTFGLPRPDGNAGDTSALFDPISIFYDRSNEGSGLGGDFGWFSGLDDFTSIWGSGSSGGGSSSATSSSGKVYPSNADNLNYHLYANPNKGSDKLLERFHPKYMAKNPSGSSQAPMGFFIIDALERGTAREQAITDLHLKYPRLENEITTLKEDKTPGGATVVEQYSGRVWYAGFSGEVIDGDSRSPRMSSYVLFSQVVTDPSQIENCFQEADPTSPIDSDLVETDGGFIKLDGAYGIKKLIASDSSLFVFAENGVWRISGSDGDSFRATSFSSHKLTDNGCISSGSVVETRDGLFYWGESDIFIVAKNEFGDWEVQNLTETTIKTFYSEISSSDKAGVVGYHDNGNNNIRWLYGTQLGDSQGSKELVLNTKFRAFVPYEISHSSLVSGPFSVSGGQTVSVPTNEVVTVSDVDVTVGGVDVTVSTTHQVRNASSSFYCVVISTSPTITYTFGGYKEGELLDWVDFGGGVSTEAYLVTGPITGGDGRLRKNVPYLTTYFKETYGEDQSGFESSCLVSSQWDWTNSSVASKWSNPRQAYRVTRSVAGRPLIATRNKIRGFGRSVAFKFESEEGKDLSLYGWDFNVEATSEE